jgi:hypothetical protein
MVSRTIASEYLLPGDGWSNLAHEKSNAGISIQHDKGAQERHAVVSVTQINSGSTGTLINAWL